METKVRVRGENDRDIVKERNRGRRGYKDRTQRNMINQKGFCKGSGLKTWGLTTEPLNKLF